MVRFALIVVCFFAMVWVFAPQWDGEGPSRRRRTARRAILAVGSVLVATFVIITLFFGGIATI